MHAYVCMYYVQPLGELCEYVEICQYVELYVYVYVCVNVLATWSAVLCEQAECGVVWKQIFDVAKYCRVELWPSSDQRRAQRSAASYVP